MTQFLEYDVGYNQKIRVNTTANEVFTMDMDRNIDDMENALSKLKEIEAVKTDLERMMETMDEDHPDYANLKATYDAAEKDKNIPCWSVLPLLPSHQYPR